MRERTRVKKQELELRQRRKRMISEQRAEAESAMRQAEAAEQRARIAENEARRARAEAEARQQRAALHEQGMADHELVSEHERERFAGTSAVPRADGQATARDGRERTAAYREGRRAAHDSSRVEDFQEGRRQERHDGGGLFGRFRRRSERQEAGQR
jgi:hypothetical protein